tara:strand:+ start:26 stop:562 length:537 start_codon:yes stop_codon:yes gene_type:complete
MTKDEALKLALEALERCVATCFDPYEHEQAMSGSEHFVNQTITAIKEALAQPEFIKHEVTNADDWSEWVCPDPKNYLMKCCDCGLVHEAEFGVVRYKSETEREDCDIVDDPNLQAVFRMRRSEQWSPEDTAHRSGGLPMAQRTWVGLTDEEITQIIETGLGIRDSIETALDKLKEKNA